MEQKTSYCLRSSHYTLIDASGGLFPKNTTSEDKSQPQLLIGMSCFRKVGHQRI